MYTMLLCVIYLIFISLGLPDSLLGSAWPSMRLEFGAPIAAAGMISMIIAGGTICSSFLSERLIKTFSTRGVTIVSVFLTAFALFGFSVSTQFWMLCLWAIPYGLGAGAIDSAINHYVALHYHGRHMSWLHCFWGVGTIISPYIMSTALTYGLGWRGGYRSVSAIQIIIALVLILTLPLWKVHPSLKQVQEEHAVLGLRGVLKIRGTASLFLGFFAYCAAEGTAMLWASSYFAATKGFSEQQAAALGSLFFIGMTVGRFAAGFVSDGLGDHRMIRMGTFVAAVGIFALMLPVQNEIFSYIGFIVFGLGCAPIYPSIIHSTPDHFGAENSQAIIGIQMASAYVGMTFMPPVFGWIAQRIGLTFMPFYLLAFFILMFIMLEKTYRTTYSK